ncbi:MAG TPA: glycosyltransferase [Segetibacter sp.]
MYKKRAVLSAFKKINITILVAPLDWGLGHATRCIPLIRHLLTLNCNVIIAAEGATEKLLKNEFPFLQFERLPGYNIRYAGRKRFFTLKIIQQLPKILFSIKKEKKWLENLLLTNKINAVISDNRYGLYNSKIKSVFITHQLCIKTPFSFLQKLITLLNYQLIKKFDACWVPDIKEQPGMAGALSHPGILPGITTTYLGGISRFDKTEQNGNKFDFLIVVSGPEPQRTSLESKLLTQLTDFKGKAMLVRGLPNSTETLPSNKYLEIKNHLNAAEMEQAFGESNIIISRSGYTTVMDICKLQKKSILIPTPGQTEQEYLAKHLEKQGWCIAANQQDFDLKEQLEKAKYFNFRLPNLKMEFYKQVLNQFIETL